MEVNGMRKQKSFASTLTAEMVASVIVPAANGKETKIRVIFDDFHEVADWAKEAVTYLKEKNIMVGYNHLIMPKQPLTRGEAVKMLAVSLGLAPNTTNTKKFSDLAGHWCEKYVNAMMNSVYADVIEGTEEKTFEPNQPITLEQFSEMVTTSFHLQLDGKDSILTATGNEYTNILVTNGIFTNKFVSNKTITREEAAVCFYRLLKKEEQSKSSTELKLVSVTVQGNEHVIFENNTFKMTQGQSIRSIIFELNERVEKLEKNLLVYMVKGDKKIAYGSLSEAEGKLVVTPFENKEKASITGEFTFDVEGLTSIQSVTGRTFGKDFRLPKLLVENNELPVKAIIANRNNAVQLNRGSVNFKFN